MPVDIQDVRQVADELSGRFEEFKKSNDARLNGIQQEKSKLAELVEKQNTQLSELEAYKKSIESDLLALKRPGGTGGNADADAHKKAFGQFMRKGRDDGLGELQHKALSIGTDADGGYAVPEEIDTNIIQLQRNMSPMRAVCNQVTVGTSDYKRLVSLGGAGSGWVGETAARSETNTPTLAQVVASMGEIYANPQASQTSLDDIFFNAEKWLGEEIAREFDEKEGAAFLTGDGTNKPKGILAHTMATTADSVRAFGTLQNVITSAVGAIAADDLIKLIYTLRKGYRKDAQFMMAGTTVFAVRLMKNLEGDYLWRPGLDAGQPSTLLGYAIEENDDAPDIAASAHAVLFGDFKRTYTIVDRFGVRVLRDPYTNKPNVGFYSTKRVGGMLTDSLATKVLTIKAA